MKSEQVIVAIIIAVIIIYIVFTLVKTNKQSYKLLPKRAPVPSKQQEPSPNDKLVIVRNVSYNQISMVLKGFCNLYNQENEKAKLRMTHLSTSEFAITFPYDIDFEIFCYLVNYLVYPIELNWTPDVTGWATTAGNDMWITGKNVNKKVMLYIPDDDTEHDNVYLTTSDNLCFKLGFSMEAGNHLLITPNRNFVEPRIDITRMHGKRSEEFS